MIPDRETPAVVVVIEDGDRSVAACDGRVVIGEAKDVRGAGADETGVADHRYADIVIRSYTVQKILCPA